MFGPLLLACIPFAIFVGCLKALSWLPDSWRYSLEWVPELGMNLSFRADGLALLMGLLISGIGTLIVIYGGAYLKGHPYRNRFFVYLMLFMGAMLGVVFSDISLDCLSSGNSPASARIC